jgi:hypothetical protein
MLQVVYYERLLHFAGMHQESFKKIRLLGISNIKNLAKILKNADIFYLV